MGSKSCEKGVSEGLVYEDNTDCPSSRIRLQMFQRAPGKTVHGGRCPTGQGSRDPNVTCAPLSSDVLFREIRPTQIIRQHVKRYIHITVRQPKRPVMQLHQRRYVDSVDANAAVNKNVTHPPATGRGSDAAE